MDWLSDVQNRMKRKNQILFGKHSEFLADLEGLIQQQNHQTVILWALEFSDEIVVDMKKRYPDEERLANAVSVSRDWAAGKVKMPVAQRAILNAHAVAKEISSPADMALCHAVGQACGVVHTSGHAMGLPIYELTAIVRKHGVPACQNPVETRKQEYVERLLYWREHNKEYQRDWAAFITKES